MGFWIGKKTYFKQGLATMFLILGVGLLITNGIMGIAYCLGALRYHGTIPMARVLMINRLGPIVGPYVFIAVYGFFFFQLRRRNPYWRLQWSYRILAITSVVIHIIYWLVGGLAQCLSLRWLGLCCVISMIPVLAHQLGDRFAVAADVRTLEGGLTKREREIVDLIAKGKSAREISDALFVSESTVKNHIYNIYRKLGVKNRVQLLGRVSSTPTSSQTRN